ncbi:MAG: DUF87 domain-containing protein [Pseudomonadota bacterium]
MDNDALMRRISAATEARKQAKAVSTPRPEPEHGIRSPGLATRPVAPQPNHLHRILQGDNPPAAAATPQPAHPHQQASHHQPAPQAQPTHPVTQPTMQPPVQQPAHQQVTAPPMTTPQLAETQPVPQAPVALQSVAETPVAPALPEQTPSHHSAPDPSSGLLMSFRPPPPEENTIPETPREQRMKREDRPEAFVIESDSTMATVQGDTRCVDTVTGLTWAVGRMLSIVVGKNRIVAMICSIESPKDGEAAEGHKPLLFRVELQGEVQDREGGKMSFQKGISSYPGVGSPVHQIRAADLAAIYACTGDANAVVGALSQDEAIPAYVDIPAMLSKHFAVLGSTGCGKSASVSLLLHACQEMVPDLRTIILDPHNEYGRAFPEANVIEQRSMDIPFWMFQLEEYVECLFRGKPIVHEEIDALREFIPEAKLRFRDGEDRVKIRPDNSGPPVTADSAMPYRMADLIALIDEEMGLLESGHDRLHLKSLKARINSHATDQRYAFMFRHRTIEDIAWHVVANFFNFNDDGARTTIIEMAGMPAEVVNAVASVLCRLSFELAIAAKGNMKVLVVCEEAHRYVPAGRDGFEPTRRAIARIAKEGRKYGSFMAIVSQRPSELDPTILSQCSTVFSLRLTNDFDQDIIKRAISSSSASTVAFISSLSNRECIAFGEGMSTAMRMKFRSLPKQWLPGAETDVFGNAVPITTVQQAGPVFHQWRQGAG